MKRLKMEQLPAAFDPSEKLIQDFATRCAMETYEFVDICKHCGFTEERGRAVQATEAYRRYFEAARREWTSEKNTVAAAEYESAVAYRASIPHLYSMLHDPELPGTARIEAAKLLRAAGKVGERSAVGDGGGGEMVKITINLGSDQKITFEKPAPVIEHEAVTA